jgi:hypothetical protein
MGKDSMKTHVKQFLHQETLPKVGEIWYVDSSPDRPCVVIEITKLIPIADALPEEWFKVTFLWDNGRIEDYNWCDWLENGERKTRAGGKWKRFRDK